MFRPEAQKIGGWLQELRDDELSPLLNIGSGTTFSRMTEQPWVDHFIFAPLRGRGVNVIHVDIADGPGIDLNADILSDDGYAKITALAPRFILLANVLEHVPDPAEMVKRCREALQPGGRLLVTVPRSYPHHTRFDTMLRPTPEEVAVWAPEETVERAGIFDAGYHWDEIFRNPRKAMLAKVKWLFTPYKISMLLLKKPAAEQGAAGLGDRALETVSV